MLPSRASPVPEYCAPKLESGSTSHGLPMALLAEMVVLRLRYIYNKPEIDPVSFVLPTKTKLSSDMYIT